MPQIQRPLFMTGENPCIGLYLPGSERPCTMASYWHCSDSLHGVGNALILWAPARDPFRDGWILSDNLPLARLLVEDLTQHFPEFEGIPLSALAYDPAECSHRFDGETYRATARTDRVLIELEWREPLDRKRVHWPGFPAGAARFDLVTVICPCKTASILINGKRVDGEARLEPSSDGHLSSTAFLAFGESWVGPL